MLDVADGGDLGAELLSMLGTFGPFESDCGAVVENALEDGGGCPWRPAGPRSGTLRETGDLAEVTILEAQLFAFQRLPCHRCLSSITDSILDDQSHDDGQDRS